MMRIGIGLFWISILSAPGLSMDLSMKMELQEKWEHKISQVVKTADSQAQVFVQFEEKKLSEEVSETPYLYQNEGLFFKINPEFSKVNVLIVTRLEQLPPSTKNLIKKITKDLKAPLAITLEPLPAEADSSLASPPPIPVEVKGLEKLNAGFSQLGQWLWTALGMMSFFGLLGGLFFIKGRKEETSTVASSEVSQKEWLKGYSEESFAALLSDCYWCEKDAYAAYVWRRIPVELRKGVLGSTTFLRTYVENLANQTEENLKWLDHPYYFNPLSINHSDNRSLTEMVRKHPILIHKLSPLRCSQLSLSTPERVRLELDAYKKTAVPDLKSVPPSQERQFTLSSFIEILTVQEEEEIQRNKGLPIELKARIPSLQWFSDLPQEKRAQILESFSANELASAWIGPLPVLETLKKSLSEPKRRAVMEALNEQKPDRKSPSFKKLHSAIVEALRMEKGTLAQDSKKAA